MKLPFPLLFAALALSACGDSTPETTPPEAAPEMPASEPAKTGTSTMGTRGEMYKDLPMPAPMAKDEERATILFSNQTEAAGVAFLDWNGSWRDRKRSIIEAIGQGAAWLDDDRDGHLDLYVANGSSLNELPDPLPTSHFFKNKGDGTFEDKSVESGLASTNWNNGACAADYDNDGDTDIFVTNWGPHSLYQNDGEGHFTDVAGDAGVAEMDVNLTPWGISSAWGDVDLDGNLDLYVGHYLGFDPANPPHGGETQNWKGMRDAYYGPSGLSIQRDFLFRSNGDGTFRDGSKEAGILGVEAAYTLGCLFFDSNLDGFPDLYVANDSQPNYLFIGDGTGNMTERGALAGLAYGEQGNAQAGMGVDAADFDADGDDDLVVTNFDDDVNTLYKNGGRTFRDITVRTGLAGPSRNALCWGVGFQDFDLDADLDLFIACGHVYPSAETDDPNTSYRQKNQLYFQDKKRLKLFPDAGPGLDVHGSSRGAAFGDYDADGDIDIFVTNLNEVGTLIRNDTQTTGHFLEVRLVSSSGNRDAIGARVTITIGDLVRSAERHAGQSFLSTNSPWLHFGLGDFEGELPQASVAVRWPGAETKTYGPFALDQHVVIEE
jgi:hypothetical protein